MDELKVKLDAHFNAQRDKLDALLRDIYYGFDCFWGKKVLLLPVEVVDMIQRRCSERDADEELLRQCTERCALQRDLRVEWICAPWLFAGSWRLLLLECGGGEFNWAIFTSKETRGVEADSFALRNALQAWCGYMKWCSVDSRVTVTARILTWRMEEVDAGLLCLAGNFRRFGAARGRLAELDEEQDSTMWDGEEKSDSTMRDGEDKSASARVPGPGSN